MTGPPDGGHWSQMAGACPVVNFLQQFPPLEVDRWTSFQARQERLEDWHISVACTEARSQPMLCDNDFLSTRGEGAKAQPNDASWWLPEEESR